MDIGTIGASLAGALGAGFIFYPLDTARILHQTSTNVISSTRPSLFRYFRGVGTSLAITAPAFTIYITGYRQTKSYLSKYLGPEALSNYMLSGIVAEVSSSGLWTAMEVLKGRMQIMDPQRKSVSGVKLAADLFRKGELFRGYFMGLVVFVPHAAIWWTTYEVVKDNMKKRMHVTQFNTFHYGLASASASLVGSTTTNFLDVIKTRQQLAASEEIRRLRPDDMQSVTQVAKNLIKEHGLFRALFKGLHIRLMHSLPSGVLSMMIVEKLKPEAKYSTDLLDAPGTINSSLSDLES